MLWAWSVIFSGRLSGRWGKCVNNNQWAQISGKSARSRFCRVGGFTHTTRVRWPGAHVAWKQCITAMRPTFSVKQTQPMLEKRVATIGGTNIPWFARIGECFAIDWIGKHGDPEWPCYEQTWQEFQTHE